MSIQSGKATLQSAYKKLLEAWARTEEDWLDAKRTEFEETFIAPLEAVVKTALVDADDLAKLIAAAKRDCM